MDLGRKYDLEELAEAIDKARSTSEREYYERIAYSIMHESTKITSLREKLMRAFRARDMYAYKAAQAEIQYWKQKETNGASWGSLKGNQRLT